MIFDISIPSAASQSPDFRITARQDLGEDREYPAEGVRQIAGIVDIPDRQERQQQFQCFRLRRDSCGRVQPAMEFVCEQCQLAEQELVTPG